MTYRCAMNEEIEISICSSEDVDNVTIVLNDESRNHMIDLSREDAVAFAREILSFYGIK